jgi:hypothetical protein
MLLFSNTTNLGKVPVVGCFGFGSGCSCSHTSHGSDPKLITTPPLGTTFLFDVFPVAVNFKYWLYNNKTNIFCRVKV